MGKASKTGVKGYGQYAKLAPVRSEAERNAIVEANMGLVGRAAAVTASSQSCRGKRCTSSYDFDDAFQEAAFRFVQRAESHDPEKGKLSTHCFGTMVTIARRNLKSTSKPVYVPTGTVGILKQITAEANRRNVPLTSDAIRAVAASLGIPKDRADRAVAASVAFEAEYEAEFFGSMAAPDPLRDEPPAEDEIRAAKDAVSRMLATIPRRWADLLTMYFGLDGSPPMTYQAIGERMGFSQQYAGETIRRALVRLRAKFAPAPAVEVVAA